jgi:hypothetical protein
MTAKTREESKEYSSDRNSPWGYFHSTLRVDSSPPSRRNSVKSLTQSQPSNREGPTSREKDARRLMSIAIVSGTNRRQPPTCTGSIARHGQLRKINSNTIPSARSRVCLFDHRSVLHSRPRFGRALVRSSTHIMKVDGVSSSSKFSIPIELIEIMLGILGIFSELFS